MRLLAPWMLLATAAGCADLTRPGRTIYPELPEDRGTLVGATNPGSILAPRWSASSARLYFEQMTRPASGPPTFDVREVTVAGNTSRVVHALSGTTMRDLVMTPDEQWAFFSTVSTEPGVTTPPSLYRLRLPDGAPELLPRKLTPSIASVAQWASPLRVSPDGSTLAYVAEGDSLFVLTVATAQSRFVTTSCRSVAAFSPSSTQVICASSGGTLSTVNLGDGTRTALSEPGTDVFIRTQAVRWDASGIRLIYAEQLELFVVNLQTQQTQKIRSPTDSSLMSGAEDWKMDWSADGTIVAYWRWECLRATGFLSCEVQWLLELLDLRDLTRRHVAVVKPLVNDTFMGEIALSPDGQRVAYQIAGSMYVADVP